MPIDPTARSRYHDLGPATIRDLTPEALVRLTRRALLTVYTPQQTAIWLAAHASGDPLVVVTKARRLCGIDDRTPTGAVSNLGGTDIALGPSIDDNELSIQVKGGAMAHRRTDDTSTIAMVPAASRQITGQITEGARSDHTPRVESPPEARVLLTSPPPTASSGRPPTDAIGQHERDPDPTAIRPVHPLSELQVHEILLAATRDIFTSEQPEEIQSLLLETVDRLGGRISRVEDAGAENLPIDLSLGVGEPLLATPEPHVPAAGEHLRRHLPRLVEDARRAIARVERSGQLAADAEHDALTGVFNRRAYERFAGRLRRGDVLLLLDLDDFKVVNDTHGHVAGDQVLRIFGAVLRNQMRITEHAVRLGGDEFLIVLEDPGEDAAELLLERLHVAWRQRRPLPVTFSAGVARVKSGIDAALDAADRALYEHKRARTRPSGGSRRRA